MEMPVQQSLKELLQRKVEALQKEASLCERASPHRPTRAAPLCGPPPPALSPADADNYYLMELCIITLYSLQ
ncbi:unnamed protein product [Boreogadus saida]